MNWDQIEGNWKQIKGEAQAQWGKLTNDDLDVAAGNREKLVGKLQRDSRNREKVDEGDKAIGLRSTRVAKSDKSKGWMKHVVTSGCPKLTEFDLLKSQ